MVETETKVQRYERYKDSGVEWLGEIPEHWEVTRLANIGRFSSSGIDKLIKKNESLVKIINYTDVYGNLKFSIDSKINFMEVTTQESNKLKNLVKKGDLIFLPSSETLEDLGLCALIDEDIINLSFSYHVLRFKFTKTLAHNFKKYFTNNYTILNEFSKKGTGSIRKTLGRNNFRNTIVVLPPLSEQTAIAQFLDDKTTKIDDAIAIKAHQISLLKEREVALIENSVTKGINPNVKFKNSGVRWLDDIPKHWEVVRSKRLFEARKQKSRISDEQLTASQKYGVIPQKMYMELEGRKVTQVEFNPEILKRVRKGDFVISMRSFQGGIEFCDYDGCVSSAYVPLIPIKHIETSFYKYLLKSRRYINELSSTSNLVRDGQALRFDNFSQVDLLIIPIEEQKEIASFLDEQIAKTAKIINLKQQEITKLKEYKSSLINGVVTGKVKVC